MSNSYKQQNSKSESSIQDKVRALREAQAERLKVASKILAAPKRKDTAKSGRR